VTDSVPVNFAALKRHVMEAPHLFAMLGVTQQSSQAEIDAARRSLAWIAHPDHNPDEPHADRVMALINEAHLTLSTPQKRRQYMARLGGTPCKRCLSRGAEKIVQGFKGVVFSVCLDCLGSGRVKGQS
jgi:DnaJ-class molecular chaperone